MYATLKLKTSFDNVNLMNTKLIGEGKAEGRRQRAEGFIFHNYN
jgi:hypothetical protein